MSTFSSTPVVIDGKGHLLGRLASIVSKQVSWEDWEGKSVWGGMERWCVEWINPKEMGGWTLGTQRDGEWSREI
jgi:hypothetical protein